MRTPLIAANWKMNYTVSESLQFIMGFQRKFTSQQSIEIALFPPYTALYSLSVAFTEFTGIQLGAQNCHWEKSGAYTGEVSPVFLQELNCAYVLIGHSERRHLFGETDEMIAKKVAAVLETNLAPILCIGETAQERSQEKTNAVLERQLKSALTLETELKVKPFVIAYEPVWAIGTGNNASPEAAQEVHGMIRQWLKQNGLKANEIRILYGGSVNPENAAQFMTQPDIDGLLVGGASLEVDRFLKIVNY